MSVGKRVFSTNETEAQSRGPCTESNLILRLSCLAWVLAVGVGLCLLWSYENTPGEKSTPPRAWPAESAIQRSQDRFTLVMAVHPKCPCTRASLEELAKLMAGCQGRLKAYVVFVQPQGFSDDWGQTELWRSAESIPGVIALVDHSGREARLFQAATSGQTALYDAHGRMVFSGGITSSRGHSGDNAGRDALFSLVNSEPTELKETFVFGCPIFDSNSECRR